MRCLAFGKPARLFNGMQFRPGDEYALIVQTTSVLRKRRTQDPEKVMQVYLRACLEVFGVDGACIVSAERGRGTVIEYSIPREGAWNMQLLHQLIHGTVGQSPKDVLAARLRRRGRTWGAIALLRNEGFDATQRRALSRIAEEIDFLVGRLDDESVAEARTRIDMKILRDLAPKDLYYQILDGLHRLARYDHSASLFLYDQPSGRLELVAEQIAWRKMPSERIGQGYVLPETLHGLIREDVVLGFTRHGHAWTEWTNSSGDGLASLLAPQLGSVQMPNEAGAPAGIAAEPEIGAMLIAAIGSARDGFGLLRLAAVGTDAFNEHELNIVRRFLPAVSVALRRAQTFESVERKVLDVERRATLAHTARGVAHDVNNALGSVLPLVQQMRVDLAEGRLGKGRLEADLAQIEEALEVACRIFTGMLRLARGSTSAGATCEVGKAIGNACAVLGSWMERTGVLRVIEMPADLPSVAGKLYEMEQVFLSLATNAIEAMPRGGELRITAWVDNDRVLVDVADTGQGIPLELMSEVEKAFVTTKDNGTGLGLPTCKAILLSAGGDLSITSEPGHGTRVRVRLCVAGAES